MQSTDCLHLCQFYLGKWLTTAHSVPITTLHFYSLGRWCSTTDGESISDNSYYSQNENMSGLNSAFSNQNCQRECSVFVRFRVSLCHSTLCVYTVVNINTCSFPTGLGLCLLAQSLLREFFSARAKKKKKKRKRKKNHTTKTHKTRQICMYVCMRACVCTCIYACMHVCFHARMSVRTHAFAVVLSNIFGDANNI